MVGRTRRTELHATGHTRKSVQDRARKDRRVEKTRDALHAALGSLILERPFDEISLQEILDRANVGRSTFYTHFRNKDELLTESIREMLDAIPTDPRPRPKAWHDRTLRFSLPIFDHHSRHLRASEAKMGAHGRAILHKHLEMVLTELIADELEADPPASQRSSAIPTDLLARYLASTFVLVLNWWVERRKGFSAQQADQLFRTVVLPTLKLAR